MSQASHMSESVIQTTFHKFNQLFAKEFYHDHVYLPTGDEQDKVIPPPCHPLPPPRPSLCRLRTLFFVCLAPKM